jgi:ubiquitin-like 1-activating enzyme E1 A
MINDKEAEVYDRQIRLWGVEAQKRIQNAKVLLCGMRALNAEVCKNLVLAGISATIQDHEAVTPADIGAQFFLTADDVGKNRAAASLERVTELNSLVSVDCVTEPLDSQPGTIRIYLHMVVDFAICYKTVFSTSSW